MTDNNMIVLSFAGDGQRQAEQLADALAVPAAEINVHTFPDGEQRVRLPVPLPPCVVMMRSLDRPNDKIIALLLAAAAARDNGIKQLILVTPYLCYMRQDMAFYPGEAISQRVIGALLADAFDAVLTVDPHLHRIRDLHQAVPATQAITLSATGLMGEFLGRHAKNPLLLGPDEESRQWVAAIAAGHALDFNVAAKRRLGDQVVEVALPADCSVAGRHVILVDDVASTGRTLLAAAQAAKQAGAISVAAMVTHALFAGDAWQHLQTAEIDVVWSSDSISHASNVVALAPLLADGVRQCL